MVAILAAGRRQSVGRSSVEDISQLIDQHKNGQLTN
jgi:hypothetical protein